MEELFYTDEEQIRQIIGDFSREILPMKRKDQPFFSKYRVFNYKDELAKAHGFDYAPQAPKEFIKDFAGYFENTVNWDSTGVLYNIHPNVNVYGQVASFFAQFANPNFAQDISSGKLMLIEKQLINYFAELAGWDVNQAGGVFTFGGKGTNLYGLKIALDKVYPSLRTKGLNGKVKVISNDLGHPCHVEICNWMGIGTDNCIRLETTNTMLAVSTFETAFEEIISNGEILPLIILNGISTLNHAVDDIKAISEARDRIVAKHNLNYTPHIHVDSVLGWVYLIINRYDFSKNPLNIQPEILSILKEKCEKMKDIVYADSFGADFHKSGFCGYSSSLFMTKDKKHLHTIEDSYEEDDGLEFSKYSPYNYTLELSRSSHGPVSAFATLRTLGVEGFVRIIANLTESFVYLKDEFYNQAHTEVLNYGEHSNVMFFIFKPDTTLKITENMDPELVEKIKVFNTGFYQFLIKKLEKGQANIFFSCSRSHKYLGQSFGSIKVYSYNSHFNVKEAEKVKNEINAIFAEYLESPKVDASYNIFDFLDVKGLSEHV